MSRRATVRHRRRAGIGASLAFVTLAALGAAGPADALGNARGDTCRSLIAAKARVHAAAVSRESTLTALVTTLQARPDPWALNAGQVSALQSANSGISALDTRVQGTCYSTVAQFRADASPLWTNYRVYWLRVPQTHGVLAADRLADAQARLANVEARLAAHVGSNVKAQSDLTEMNQDLAAARQALGTPPTPPADIAMLPTLAPAADMSADVAAMETARTSLTSARASLVAARASGLAVIADLGG